MTVTMRHDGLFAILIATVLLLPTPGSAGPPSGPERLQKKYRAIAEPLQNNVYGHPIYIESKEKSARMRGDIYSLVDHPFKRVSANFSQAENWCDVVPQHLNVKACTYQTRKGRTRITFYTGRKYYDPPGRAFRLIYDYRLVAHSDDYLKAVLTADAGPLDTKDYLLLLEAIPLDDKTFIHFSYSYRYKLVTRMANTAYLKGLGSGKVGFSVTGKDKKGRPKYVRGIQGVVERNAMRYFLAIDAYLDTLDEPEASRFERRIERWFDLTEQYPRQLKELEKQDYLRYKRKERLEQLALQRELDKNGCIKSGYWRRLLTLSDNDCQPGSKP